MGCLHGLNPLDPHVDPHRVVLNTTQRLALLRVGRLDPHGTARNATPRLALLRVRKLDPHRVVLKTQRLALWCLEKFATAEIARNPNRPGCSKWEWAIAQRAMLLHHW